MQASERPEARTSTTPHPHHTLGIRVGGHSGLAAATIAGRPARLLLDGALSGSDATGEILEHDLVGTIPQAIAAVRGAKPATATVHPPLES